mgnify:FL=1
MIIKEEKLRNLIRKTILERQEQFYGNYRSDDNFTEFEESEPDLEGPTESSLTDDEIGRARSSSIQSSFKLDRFLTEVISGMGVPTSNNDESLKLFRAMARLENAASKNNPLATTMGGSRYELDPVKPKFNSVGVKNYATFLDGVTATIDTFIDQKYSYLYASIVDNMKSGKTAVDILLDPDSRYGFDKWGGSSEGKYADKMLKILAGGTVSVPSKMNIDDPSMI